MYDDVLIPTDGGDRSSFVVEHAVDIARRHGATVHALSVVDDRSFLTLDDDLKSTVADELSTRAESAVAEVAEAAEATDLDVVTSIREGHPVEQIRAYADRTDVDLIVLGSRGGDGYEGSMLGSISQEVVSRADRPVLVVPIDGE